MKKESVSGFGHLAGQMLKKGVVTGHECDVSRVGHDHVGQPVTLCAMSITQTDWAWRQGSEEATFSGAVQ